MLKHKIVIDVADPNGEKANVLRGGEIKLHNNLLNRLLGKGHKMLVLVPSDIVESVAIREIGKKGEEENEISIKDNEVKDRR